MAQQLKAIETVYKGYRFRSRLEARWAVFFDTLDVRWEYEKEGYDLDGVWYLPDFWLPEQDCWCEVKGQTPTSEEIEKARRLQDHSGKLVYMLYGSMDTAQRPEIAVPGPGWRVLVYPHEFVPCPVCRKVEVIWAGQLNQLRCGCLDDFASSIRELYNKIEDHGRNDDGDEVMGRLYQWLNGGADLPSVVRAYQAATWARFEHGEKGGQP